MQTALIFLGAGLTIFTAIALGTLLLRRECVALRFVVGAAMLSGVALALGAAGLIKASWCGAIAGLAILWCVARIRAYRVAIPRHAWLTYGLLAAFGYQYLMTALAPEASREGAGRHLAFASQYARTHHIGSWPESSMDTLYAFAFVFGKHSSGALVHLAFLAALIALMLDFGGRTKSRAAAATAAILVFVSPAVAVDASSAGSDVARAAAAFGCFYAIWIWRERRDWRLLLATAILFGTVLWSARGPITSFPPDPKSLVPSAALTLTTRGDSQQGFLGPLFLLLPLGLLAARDKLGCSILASGVLLVGLTAGHLGARTLIPALVFFAFAFGLVLQRWPGMAFPVMAFQLVTCWPGMETLYANYDALRFHQASIRAALRIVPEPVFLASRVPGFNTAEYLNRHSDRTAKILALTWLPAAYIERNTAFDPAMQDALECARTPMVRMEWTLKPAKRDVVRLFSRGDWRVSEFRILGPLEIPRDRSWSLRGGTELAFDNNPATCWRGGPGSRLEVRFSQPVEITGVRVDACQAVAPELTLDGPDVHPATHVLEPPPEARRAAADFLWSRGFTHIVLPSNDPLTQDLQEHWLDWSIFRIAEVDGQTIFEVMPRLGAGGLE